MDCLSTRYLCLYDQLKKWMISNTPQYQAIDHIIHVYIKITLFWFIWWGNKYTILEIYRFQMNVSRHRYVIILQQLLSALRKHNTLRNNESTPVSIWLIISLLPTFVFCYKYVIELAYLYIFCSNINITLILSWRFT